MELRQLRHARVLAECGSYVRAAEELLITQSALTRSIQALEDELGVTLFVRGRQGAQPTPEGQLFIERADLVQLTINGLRSDLALIKKGEFGKIVFGMGPLVAAVFMVDLLTEILNVYPRLTVHTEISNGEKLLEALLSERIEFFISSLGTVALNPKIVTASIGPLPLSLFARSDHPLAGKSNIARSDLMRYRFISGEFPEAAQSTWKRFDEGTEIEWLSPAVNCEDYSIVKEVSLKSDTIFLASHAVVADECAQGLMVAISAAGCGIPRTTQLAVVSLFGRKLSPPAELIIGLLKSRLQSQSVLER